MLRPDMEGRAAYRLMPENVQFAKPVIVTMKYNLVDLTPGTEDVLSIAYQGSNGKWMGTNASLDKATKTLTVETTHFSDYTFYEAYEIFSNRKELGGGEVADIRVGVHAVHPVTRNYMKSSQKSPLPTPVTMNYPIVRHFSPM